METTVKLSPKEAVLLGVRNGWTAKQTAFETGHSHPCLIYKANRMGVAFAWSRLGPMPKHAKEKVSINTLIKRDKHTIEEASTMMQKLVRMLPKGSKQELAAMKVLGYLKMRRMPPRWIKNVSKSDWKLASKPVSV